MRILLDGLVTPGSRPPTLQWWRLLTPFLYFGPINFDFFLQMFFLYVPTMRAPQVTPAFGHADMAPRRALRMRYCRILEEESFANRPADFLFMLLFGAATMLAVSPLIRASFLSSALTAMIVYIWTRRNPEQMMNFLGIFNFAAPLMPWVLLAFSYLVSGTLPIDNLLGIAVGHTYYYLVDVYPRLYNRPPPLQTPAFLGALLNPPPYEEARLPSPPPLERAGEASADDRHALEAGPAKDEVPLTAAQGGDAGPHAGEEEVCAAEEDVRAAKED